MLKIHYLQTPDGDTLFFDCYIQERKEAYQYLLDQGYEIVGES